MLAPWAFVLATASARAPQDDERPALSILCPAAWIELARPLAEARSKQLALELTALEDVLASSSEGDAPERIKRHLFEAWRTRRVRYALLVGDSDVFPVRFMALDRFTPAAANFAFYACDLYYADVARADGSFDDWNAHREGPFARYFGEVRGEALKSDPINMDAISYVPELAVGRFPVSTPEELRAVVAKTLSWVPRGEHASLWIHASGWIDERERVQRIVTQQGELGARTATQLFGGADALPTRASVVAAWSGAVDTIYHLGHGSPATWEGCLALEDLGLLRERRPLIALSAGCNTAEFCVEPPYHAYLDEHGIQHRGTNAGEVFAAPPAPPASLQPGPYDLTGIGEELVRAPSGGAVVYIGCATGAQPCAVTLLEQFALSASRSDCARAGDAWRTAVARYHELEHLAELRPNDDWYPPAVYFQAMKFLYFGDPSLPLR